MEYLVIGADGQEYGPVSVDTLKQWVADNRVGADSNLKEFSTGRVLQARSVPFLFPAISAPPVNTYAPSSSQRAGEGFTMAKPSNAGQSDVFWAIGRSILALVLFFVLGGLGLIVGIYGLVYAVRGYQAGHKLGIVAIVISVLTLIAIGIGWMVRLSHVGAVAN